MNIAYWVLALCGIAAGVYGTLQVKSLLGSDRPNKTEVRFIGCVERGKTANDCALEQLILRGLTCPK